MQPYRVHKKGYIARSTRYMVASIKPTRSAAGMSFTASRGGGPMSDDARALSVFGTLDPLRRKATFQTERVPCPCCGKKSDRVVLSDVGRRRLRALRTGRTAAHGI